MTPTLVDLLAGATQSVLMLHLSDAPLIEPYSLANLSEPSWFGYAPAPMKLQQQSAAASGWAWIQGSGTFTYLGNLPAPLLSGVFVTASYQGTEYLLCVVDLAETDFRNLELGTNTFSVRVDQYVMPQS